MRYEGWAWGLIAIWVLGACCLLGCPDVVVALDPWPETDDDDDTMPLDEDGDGFTVAEGDCNDGDDTVHPGAEEVCDNQDNDCDGSLLVSEDDGDGDGYPLCAGDCDDGDPDVSPGAAEIPYDGIDNNCMEGDFTDVDGDGHDWDGMDDGDDCDDSDATVFPGAEEISGDGVDSNCDGLDNIPLGDYCYGDDNTIPVPGWAMFSLSSWYDATDGPAGPSHYYDDIEFEAEAGWLLTIAMNESTWTLDPYLYLLDTSCQVMAEDDNGGGEDDALLEIEIPLAGVYTLIATSASEWNTGTYEIQIEIL